MFRGPLWTVHPALGANWEHAVGQREMGSPMGAACQYADWVLFGRDVVGDRGTSYLSKLRDLVVRMR